MVGLIRFFSMLEYHASSAKSINACFVPEKKKKAISACENFKTGSVERG
jgi:hypothetical protein